MNKNIKKIIKIFSVIFLTVLLAACSNSDSDSEASDNKEKTIGISMPSKSLERWEKDGNYMVQKLEELGYKTDIQYAQDGVPTQVSQIEDMVTKEVDALVIASIDGEALTNIIDRAQGLEIPVIAYDRLIMNTEGIDYYATFDLLEVGRMQGQYIVDKLDLENEDGPFNIELFGGAPDDNNAHIYFDGAMSALQPYIDEGKLVVQSGQTAFNQVATLDWSSSEAQSRMDNIISSSYTNENIDAVLTQNDAIAIGVVSSLQSVGYGSDDRPMPIITGQDAETASIQSIVDGGQTMTVFKDTESLASETVDMIDSILNEEDVKIDDTETYDNNTKIVPTRLLDPIAVDKENYQEVIIDSGYIDASDINN